MDLALQAPVSTGFFRQEYESGLPCPPPRNLPDPGTELKSRLLFLHWQVDSLPLALPGKPIHTHESESVSHLVVSDSL